MSTKEARANFADLLGRVYYTKEPVIVERKGKPVAVVISPDEYARYQHAEEERLWRVVERIQERNADQDPDEVLRDVTEAVEEVRQERNEQRTRDTTSRR